MDMEKILTYVENIAENLEGLINTLGCDRIPSEGAIYVDGNSKPVSCGIIHYEGSPWCG